MYKIAVVQRGTTHNDRNHEIVPESGSMVSTSLWHRHTSLLSLGFSDSFAAVYDCFILSECIFLPSISLALDASHTLVLAVSKTLSFLWISSSVSAHVSQATWIISHIYISAGFSCLVSLVCVGISFFCISSPGRLSP